MRLTFLVCALLAAAPAFAADIRTDRVRFEPGTDSGRAEGRIVGDEIVDHMLGAEADQHAEITMSSDNPSAYFNLIAPGEADVAFFNGSVDGNSYSGELPASGDYRVRVYLMRSAARRGESADYALDIRIGAPALEEPVKADYADGLQGGPDFWEVAGVSSTLNIRAAPSTGAEIVGRVPDGTLLRNLGCRMAEGRRWCQVEPAEGEGPGGWTAGDYLREAAGPEAAAEPRADAGATDAGATDAAMPEAGPDAGPETVEERAGRGAFDATGEVPCKQVAGQPTRGCAFGVARGQDGTAAVVVTRPDGTARALFFEQGRFVSADTSQADGYPPYAATRDADLTVVTVGDERYEIPDAVIFGG